jgi:hypothetical protein
VIIDRKVSSSGEVSHHQLDSRKARYTTRSFSPAFVDV